MGALILMACRECPLLAPIVPTEIDNLRRQLQLRKVVQFGGCTHVAKMLENRVRALGTEIQICFRALLRARAR